MNPITRLHENPRQAAAALGCVLGVFTASVAPTPPGSLAPMGSLGVVGLGKQVHATGYASLGFVFASAVRAGGHDEVAAAVLTAGAFGAGIELVQVVLPYRSFGVADAGANLASAVLGGAVWVTAVWVADIRGQGYLTPSPRGARTVKAMGTRRLIRAPGLVGIGVVGTYLLAVRPWHRRWGTTDDEATGWLPGDDFAGDADASSARVIMIMAPVRAVWPWLVRLGQGRGGFCSYERLENLFGLQIHNADRILPQHQRLDVGDEIRLGLSRSGAPSFRVAFVDTERCLMLSAPGWETDESRTTWNFVLHEVVSGATRLVIRFRGRSETLRERAVNRLVVEPVQFTMERKMLKGIRSRAERARASATGGRHH